MENVMKNFKRVVILNTLLIVLLSSGCTSFFDAFYESEEPMDTTDDIIARKYSDDIYKDEIMRLFAYNGIKIRESSIKRVAPWKYGQKFELPVQKGVAIVYFDGADLVAIRDKSDLHYIYGGPYYFSY
jgi:hypothetical protein